MELIQIFASAEAAALLKTGGRVIHFIGLVLGLGAATVLDLIILRFLIAGKVADEHASIVEFSSKIVTAGLALLWLSGIGFLLLYGLFDPVKLGNQKIWAKIAIVGVLTLNGVFIHHSILPLIRARVGRSLFDGLPSRQRMLLVTSGTVSATSWYVPLLLGAVPQLNFVVPATVILAAYATALLVGIVTMNGIVRVLLADGTHPEGALRSVFHTGGTSVRFKRIVPVVACLVCAVSLWRSSVATSPQVNASETLPQVIADASPAQVLADARPAQTASEVRDVVPAAEDAGTAEKHTAMTTATLTPSVEAQETTGTPDDPQVSVNNKPSLASNEKPPEAMASQGAEPAETPQVQPAQFVGIWAADASGCSSRGNKKGFLLTMIDEEGARAGDATCEFKSTNNTGNEWNVVAACSRGRARWTSNVRLSVSGDRLQWSSGRGTQNYVRCEPAMRLAQVRH